MFHQQVGIDSKSVVSLFLVEVGVKHLHSFNVSLALKDATELPSGEMASCRIQPLCPCKSVTISTENTIP
jgi:hypothetical protein